jgi:hypothetical protein
LDNLLASLTSILPAVAILSGFVLIMFSFGGGTVPLSQSGWGLVTIGIVVEFALPIARRLR